MGVMWLVRRTSCCRMIIECVILGWLFGVCFVNQCLFGQDGRLTMYQ